MYYEILDQYGEFFGEFESYEDAYDALLDLRDEFRGHKFKIYCGGEVAYRPY